MTLMTIKKTIADISRNWLIPPKIYRKLITFFNGYKRRITREEKEILSENAVFKGRFKGKRCFVIGNGPSLNNVDLSRLTGEITVVMNRFDLHPVLKQWQPTFYCAGDPPGAYTSESRQALKNVGEKIKPEAFFFPITMQSIIESFDIYPKEKTFYLDMRENLEDWKINKYEIELTKKTAGVQTTAILGIIIAMYAGCNKIYLLGLDFSWLAYQKIPLMAHFYEKPEANDEDNIENTWKYRQNIEAVLTMCRQYEILHLYAQKKGIEIINITENSFLDEFPQAKFEDIV
jgi:hypothetical protein